MPSIQELSSAESGPDIGDDGTDASQVFQIESILNALEEQHRVVREQADQAAKASASAAEALRVIEETVAQANAALRKAEVAVAAAERAERVKAEVDATERRVNKAQGDFENEVSGRVREARKAIDEGKETLGHLVEVQYAMHEVLGPDIGATLSRVQDMDGRSRAAMEAVRRTDAQSNELAVRVGSDERRLRQRSQLGAGLFVLLLGLIAFSLFRSGPDINPVPNALVGVLNGASVSGLAETTADDLERAGLPVAFIGNAASQDGPTKVYYRDGYSETAGRLAEALGATSVDALEVVNAGWVRQIAPSALPLHLDIVAVVGTVTEPATAP